MLVIHSIFISLYFRHTLLMLCICTGIRYKKLRISFWQTYICQHSIHSFSLLIFIIPLYHKTFEKHLFYEIDVLPIHLSFSRNATTVEIAESTAHTINAFLYPPFTFGPAAASITGTNRNAQERIPIISGMMILFASAKSKRPNTEMIADGIRFIIPPSNTA